MEEKSDATIIIDTPKRSLRVEKGGKVIKAYPVAVGSPKTPTPIGLYHIITKAHWGGPFGTRWLGLDVPWGTYGIHGTNQPSSIGKAVSHGCIRMYNRHVEEVYDLVEIGSRVNIFGQFQFETLVEGSRGNLVQLVQMVLKQKGFYEGLCDGIFGNETKLSVLAFQKENTPKVTGQIGSVDLQELGIRL